MELPWPPVVVVTVVVVVVVASTSAAALEVPRCQCEGAEDKTAASPLTFNKHCA